MSELVSNGRREISSFHGLSRGMICIEARMASAWLVLNNTALVTTGAVPRIRPAWLIRSPCPKIMRTGTKNAAMVHLWNMPNLHHGTTRTRPNQLVEPNEIEEFLTHNAKAR